MLFIVIHFRDQGLSLRTTILHCKDYILAVFYCSFIRLKRVKETFIIRFVWFCNVIEH